MDWLSKVAKHHKEYIKYVRRMGCNTHAEDLVQEAYLRLHKYSSAEKVLREDGTVNKTYVWRVLYSVWTMYYKEQAKVSKVSIECNEDLSYEPYNEAKEQAYDRIINKLNKALNELDEEGYPYNKELFNLYVGSEMSMRCISGATNISLTSIYNTLKNCREQLSDEIREDIEDYNNGDWELI